ncbi:hypothetical protein J7643_10575 [bacterium]|nr:hypothetical protein [bacterium]
MQRIDSLFKWLKTYRHAMQMLAVVLAFAVTALFSIVPFKVPRVYFFPPDLQAKAQQAPTFKTIQAPAPESLDGTINGAAQKRMDMDPHADVLLPIALLFAGLRGLASLSSWKARRVSLPHRVRFRHRAPPLAA